MADVRDIEEIAKSALTELSHADRVWVGCAAGQSMMAWMRRNSNYQHDLVKARLMELSKVQGCNREIRTGMVWHEFSQTLPTKEREAIICGIEGQVRAMGKDESAVREILDCEALEEVGGNRDELSAKRDDEALEEEVGAEEDALKLKMPDLPGLLWVLHHLHDDKVNRKQAPSMLEWSLLQEARRSPKISEMLYQKVSAKSYLASDDLQEDEAALKASGLREYLMEMWAYTARDAIATGHGPEEVRNAESKFYKDVHGRLSELQRRTARVAS